MMTQNILKPTYIILQKNDYTYNIRGWLTQMNDPAQLTEGDKFGMKLDYNMATSPGTAMFNGNISGFTWSTATLNQARYVYTYDDQNRMTYANYASTQDAGSFNVSVAYNANGNITYLQRKSSGIASDNLDFTYRGNRVTGIRDLAQDKPMVIDYPGGTTFYPLVYDSSGNVVLEPHKQLEIRYNLHNLPSEIIRIGQNQRIRYYYTFDGLKLARQYEDNGTVTGTDYCGPFVYETVSGVRSLKYILTPHGRAIKNGSLWTREFNLRDHLGNVRVVIRKGGNGQAEIVQQKGYYPFGGEISQFSTGTGTNRHWYNGKELQDDLNLYWYDYGARFYDPMLGRWHSVDPMAETYYSLSPYNYVANNPLKFIDPNGMYIDNYGVDKVGNINLLEKTKNKYDVLYAVDKSGNKTDTNGDGSVNESDGAKVNDKSLLPQLADKTNIGHAISLGEPISGPVANTDNRTDAYNVFKFAAENSNVEWSYQRYTDNSASIATANENSTTITGKNHVSNRGKTVSADIHSHPNATRDDLRPSGGDIYRRDVFIRLNSNAKVQLYMPKASNPNGRMLDLVKNEWILNY